MNHRGQRAGDDRGDERVALGPGRDQQGQADESGRRVLANYGLDPRLGRYHRSFCLACDRSLEGAPPLLACPKGLPCGPAVRGVLDRVAEIADFAEPRSPEHRPPYQHQVPLSFVPGLGKRTLEHLIGYFGSEMAVLHQAPRAQLVGLVGWDLASQIMLAREGRLHLATGGGGHYGKVAEPPSRQLALF